MTSCLTAGCSVHGVAGWLGLQHPTIINGTCCAVTRRQLWHDAWRAALQHTPLQQLAAQGAGDAEQRWQSDAYRAAVEGSALFQAFVRAAAAQQQLVRVRMCWVVNAWLLCVCGWPNPDG